MKTTRICAQILLTFALIGCATYSTVMKHPETGVVEICEADGDGIIPAAIAENHHNGCVQQLEKLGYQRVSK